MNPYDKTLAKKTLPFTLVLLCAGVIVSIAMGIRHGFGFWQIPITQAHGWTRETFVFALAIQNLMWGACQPFAGALADKFGAVRVVIAGAVLYALGLAGMAVATTGTGFAATAGFLIGMAQAGTTFGVVIGVVSRMVTPEKRSWAMGIVSAAGSIGQFVMMPVDNWMIDGLGWSNALFGLAFIAMLMIPFAFGLRENREQIAGTQSVGAAIKESFSTPSFLWLMAGYFVCGFQVVFIGVNLPAYLREANLPAHVGVTALMLIGLFNVFGTYYAGVLGGKVQKKWLLSGIYFGRAVLTTAFIVLPLTEWSVYVFASGMGLLWLSTVPLTSGVIGTVFGVQYMSMLSGVVFFSHQIGSFVGLWAGGILYDKTGSYFYMWVAVVVMGVFAGLANLPILEKPLARLKSAV